MKGNYKALTVLIALLMVIGFVAVNPTYAWIDSDHRPSHHWIWESDHASMINCLLITCHDCIVKNSDRFVELAKTYSDEDPLLKVYGLRKDGADSDMDAFLMGLKANNLIYLIHVADDNPAARKWAIRELKLFAQVTPVTHGMNIRDKFTYWAQLLEEGRFSSVKLSHIYVHYTIDIGDYISERMGYNKRFYFWMGYLINDFTVANLCKYQDWLTEDQRYFRLLYASRRPHLLGRYTLNAMWRATTDDLALKEAQDKTQRYLDLLKGKHMDRDQGPNNNKTIKE